MESLRTTMLQQQKAHFLLGNFCYWAMFSSGDFTSQRAHVPGQSNHDFVNLLPLLRPYSFTSQGQPTAPDHFTVSVLPNCTAQRAPESSKGQGSRPQQQPKHSRLCHPESLPTDNCSIPEQPLTHEPLILAFQCESLFTCRIKLVFP